MRARYYSPEMRRFINADVIHGQISDSTSLNRYAYVNGNPVSFTDPFGLFGIISLMLIGAGIGFVMGAVGSLVSQKVESEVKGEEFKLDVGQLVADSAWGAIDGALAFSPIGPTAKVYCDVGVSLGSALTDEFIDDQPGINLKRVGSSLVTDMMLNKLSLDFTNKTNISRAYVSTTETIVDLGNRKNKKWANDQISTLNKNFNDLLFFKKSEYIFNGIMNTGEKALLTKVDGSLDEYINLPNSMDNGIVILRK